VRYVASHPELLILAQNEVHIWRAWLPCDASMLAGCEKALTPAEKERAGRFLFEKAKREFVGTRSVLRQLLAGYLGGNPPDIQLGYGANGKPVLATNDRPVGLRFNVSHSHGLLVLAFACERDVGVDIEKICEGIASKDIARSHFSEKENEELTRLPPECRTRGFFNCWTRKEAYVKARGDGLQLPLRSFDVSIMTEQPQDITDDSGLRWSISGFELAAGFAGAVAVRGRDARLIFLEWRDSMRMLRS
jgi:4'-phosphopantetheinyl transferase